jgi:ATP-binding protein involved in chromosome partitioning
VPQISGAIAVTIPTAESERSVSRALDAAHEADVPVLGIVENLSGYACRTCHEVEPLFDGDAGARLAAAHEISLLARLPFTRASLDEVAGSFDSVATTVLTSARRT